MSKKNINPLEGLFLTLKLLKFVLLAFFMSPVFFHVWSEEPQSYTDIMSTVDIDIKVTIAQNSIENASQLDDLSIIPDYGDLELKLSTSEKWAFTMLISVYSSCYLFIFFLVEQIGRSFYQGHVFNDYQLKRIKWIGYILLIVTFIHIAGPVCLELWANSITNDTLTRVNFDTNNPVIYLNILVFYSLQVLAHAFSKGQALKNENELTI